jgi:type II secretory pathway pseudopilin PulG
MVVIFIVGILSAVAIPLMRGRADVSKWSEGKTAAGSIRTAARAYCAEKGVGYNFAGTTLRDLGFGLRADGVAISDLDGRYFTEEAYGVALTGYNMYTVTVTATASTSPDRPQAPGVVTLDQAGLFVETP